MLAIDTIELDGINSRRDYSKVFTNPTLKGNLENWWKLELNKICIVF